MRQFAAIAFLALCLIACTPRARTLPALPPLTDEGELFVYLDAVPDDSARLALSFGAVAASRSDGVDEPLELQLVELTAKDAPRQRLFAMGRVPPGTYGALLVQLRRATLLTDEGPADLLVSKEPIRIDVRLQVSRGRSSVVRVALRPGQAVERGFDFGGAFSAAVLQPASTVPQLDGFASVPDLAVLALFDRHARQVVGMVPTGREPEGLALDPPASRIYVALPAEDQIQVLDLTTGDQVRRISLSSGDRPTEIALVSGTGPLLTINTGSDSASFVDPLSGGILDRVPVGQEPWALLLDQQGRRAYVLNRRSSEITVLDVSTHLVAGRIPTDAEPIRAALNRAGTRLFVVHRGSGYMNVYSVPDYAQVNRIYVGLGVGTVRVDPRTDLVYVGRADEGVIQIFDPLAALPIGRIDVDGPVAWLALDATENMLLAGIPTLGRVVFVDLTTRRQVSAIDLARAPYQVIVPGERF